MQQNEVVVFDATTLRIRSAVYREWSAGDFSVLAGDRACAVLGGFWLPEKGDDAFAQKEEKKEEGLGRS